MLENSEKVELERKLNSLSTPEEVLKYVMENYDLENAKFGLTTKPLFISGAIKAINLVNAKRKKQRV